MSEAILFLTKFFVNFGFILLVIFLANTFNRYMANKYPFIEFSDYHYFIAMFIWCTAISIIDVIIPYGRTEYRINTLIGDLIMAFGLTMLNRYIQNKNF